MDSDVFERLLSVCIIILFVIHLTDVLAFFNHFLPFSVGCVPNVLCEPDITQLALLLIASLVQRHVEEVQV